MPLPVESAFGTSRDDIHASLTIEPVEEHDSFRALESVPAGEHFVVTRNTAADRRVATAEVCEEMPTTCLKEDASKNVGIDEVSISEEPTTPSPSVISSPTPVRDAAPDAALATGLREPGKCIAPRVDEDA